MKEDIKKMFDDLSSNGVNYISYSVISDMLECVSIIDSLNYCSSNYGSIIKSLKPFFLNPNNLENIGKAINQFQYLASTQQIKISSNDFSELKTFLYEKYLGLIDLPTTIAETYQMISKFEFICTKYGIEIPTFYVNDSFIKNDAYNFIIRSDVKSNDTYKVIFTQNDFIIRNKLYKTKFVPAYITIPIMEEIQTTMLNLKYYNDFVN